MWDGKDFTDKGGIEAEGKFYSFSKIGKRLDTKRNISLE
jgi:hypothetical protein